LFIAFSFALILEWVNYSMDIRQAFFDRWVSPRRSATITICNEARMQASCGQIQNLA